MNIIDLKEILIDNRVRWSARGNLGYGRVLKINKKTFLVQGEKHEGEFIVPKTLVFEALRD